jgi:hypothetical protein
VRTGLLEAIELQPAHVSRCGVSRKMENMMAYMMKIVKGTKFRGDAAMYAEEAAVDKGGHWQCTERFYTRFISSCRIFVKTLKTAR